MTDRYLFRGFHPYEDGAVSVWIEGEEIKGYWCLGYVYKKWHCKSGVRTDAYFIRSYIPESDTEVIPETVGQYTGLTDENGKQIFEGDILGYTSEEGELCKVRVVFDEGAFLIEEDGITDSGLLTPCVRLGFNVVGNIYQNPDILERKEKSGAD